MIYPMSSQSDKSQSIFNSFKFSQQWVLVSNTSIQRKCKCVTTVYDDYSNTHTRTHAL